MPFIRLRKYTCTPHFWIIFIRNRHWVLLNDFYASVEMINGFSILVLLIW